MGAGSGAPGPRYSPLVGEHSDLAEVRASIERGGARKYHESAAAAGKLFARERIALLTDEKIIRIIEKAYRTGIPMIYLVDSAGARITDQVEMFPGRRGAGKIFHTQ